MHINSGSIRTTVGTSTLFKAFPTATDTGPNVILKNKGPGVMYVKSGVTGSTTSVPADDTTYAGTIILVGEITAMTVNPNDDGLAMISDTASTVFVFQRGVGE